MDTRRRGRRRSRGLGLPALLAAAAPLSAQTTMPSTLRYGSGLFDVPVATVLPHLSITATYSGFRVDAPRVGVDGAGVPVQRLGQVTQWMSDASVAVGLFRRVEVGATFQSFAGADNGGTMAGAFGRVMIVRPEQFPLAVAAGARFLTSPSFDAVDPAGNFQPTRLGLPDARLVKDYDAPVPRSVSTAFSPYLVATANFPGVETQVLPRHDFTLTFGWGMGTFRDGEGVPFYAGNDSEGFFAGGAFHLGLTEDALLHLMGEYNGFDVNVGAQLDVRGIRVGAFVLGANYGTAVTEFRSRKFGIVGSVALCPADGALCGPRLRARPEPVRIVDTVRVEVPGPVRVETVTETVERMPEGYLLQKLEEPVFFEFDSYGITAETERALLEKAAILQANPGVRVHLTGYADERGPRLYNERLGMCRAESVRHFLTELGVEADRFEVESQGEEAAPEAEPRERRWAWSRRVAFQLVAGEAVTEPEAGDLVAPGAPAAEPAWTPYRCPAIPRR